MKWHGIRRDSLDVSKGAEEGLLLINGRFKVDGELRRRRGMARSNIIKKGNAVKNISGFSAFQSNVMAALVDGSNLQGYQQPAALWGDNPTQYSVPLIDTVTHMTIDYGNTILKSSYPGAPEFTPGVVTVPRDGAIAQARWFHTDTVSGLWTTRTQFRWDPNTSTGEIGVSIWLTSDPGSSTCWVVWPDDPSGVFDGTWGGGYSLSGVIGASTWPSTVTVTATYQA